MCSKSKKMLIFHYPTRLTNLILLQNLNHFFKFDEFYYGNIHGNFKPQEILQEDKKTRRQVVYSVTINPPTKTFDKYDAIRRNNG
jgi:hypothetical protein